MIEGGRSVGPGVIDAFYAGYQAINPDDYEFLCKLDLDLRLPPRYFETLMERMKANPRIATCSGKAYVEDGGRLVEEWHGDDISLGYEVLPCVVFQGDWWICARGDVGRNRLPSLPDEWMDRMQLG